MTSNRVAPAATKPAVFIHTNHRQWVGALVSAYSLERNAAVPDSFDVRYLHTRDYPTLAGREGQLYLRGGRHVPWRNDDLQSFTPLRFAAPEAMGYAGRALVIDPDVFAVGDVMELLTRDMEGKAIMCRPRPLRKDGTVGDLATSVMLMDCPKLTHWRLEADFGELFEMKRDYAKWIGLKLEREETIGFFENEWNDFDRLTAATKLLHNTKRQTQPWKTGLPQDFVMSDKFRWFPPKGWLRRGRQLLFGYHDYGGAYERHPDRNQENFFFGLVKECLEKGRFDEALLREEMAKNHIRHDALEVVARVPDLASWFPQDLAAPARAAA